MQQSSRADAAMSELKALALPTAPQPGTADFERRFAKVTTHLRCAPISGTCDENRELMLAYQRLALSGRGDQSNWPVLLRLRRAWWASSPAAALAN